MQTNYRQPELMSKRKIESDIKNKTDKLTFANTERQSSHGAAYKVIRDIEDDKELMKLENTSLKDYFDNL